MNRERLESLLWERVDETISDQGLAELEDRLASDEGARALAHQVEALARCLRPADPIDAPGELRHRIGRALDAARPPSQGQATTTRPVGRPAPWQARLLPMAAGLLIGAVLVQLAHLLPVHPADEQRAAGAIGPTEVAGPPAQLQLDLDGGSGSVRAERSGDRLSVDLELRAAAAVEVTIDAGDASLVLVSLTTGGGEANRVSVVDGRIVLGVSGPGRHTLVATVGGHQGPVRLAVRQATGTIIEGPVPAAPATAEEDPPTS